MEAHSGDARLIDDALQSSSDNWPWRGSPAARGDRPCAAGRVSALRIAIIGAGIAGLSAARALQLHGFRVRVYEQSPTLGEVGAGLTISPNATHVLNALGLADELERIGMKPARGGVKHWRSGETLVAMQRGDEMLKRYGAGYFQVHRADLHAALAGAVLAGDAEAIVLDRRVTSLRSSGGDVTQLEFASGSGVSADLVVGADGVRSRVRELLFGGEQPRFAGYIAFRGLVPMELLPREIIEPSSCLSIGPARTFTRYLLRGGSLLNYVGLSERSDWREEGWSIPSSAAEVLADYAGWYPDMRRIVGATPAGSCFKWALFYREPLPQWARGGITLIGDAAHPMLPFLGQGAAMSIEDAWVLARALAGAASLPEALRRFVAARQPRTAWVMQRSRETGERYHNADPDHYSGQQHLTAESLGLMSYNPLTVAI